ncbi:MAG: cache domain-containing protein, partial [Nitrospinae bacterium]|nr:cache domain-containing protein [Nitrospinota bacterium]
MADSKKKEEPLKQEREDLSLNVLIGDKNGQSYPPKEEKVIAAESSIVPEISKKTVIKKWALPLGIVLASAVLSLLLYTFSSLQNAIENQMKIEFNKEQRLVTDRIAFQLEETFNQVRKSANFLKSPFAMTKLLEAMDSGDKRETAFWKDGLEKVYLPFLNNYTLCRYISFADINGNEILRVERDLSGHLKAADISNLSGDPLFIETIKLDSDYTHVYIFKDMIKIGTPVYHKNKIMGAVIIGIKMEDIYSILSSVKYGEESHTMLFTDKGELLFCSHGLNREQHKGEIEYVLKNPAGGYTEIPESHGEKDVLMASSTLKVGDERWAVAIEATVGEITKRIKEFEKGKYWILGMIAALIIGLSIYFQKERSDKIKLEIR